jgi:diguanylate cyclase (GGDEF)-like protein
MLVDFERNIDAISKRAHAQDMKDFLDRWRQAYNETGSLPEKESLDKLLDTYFMDHIAIVKQQSGHHIYSYYGLGIRLESGLDMTGRSVDDFPERLSHFLNENYNHVFTEKTPIYTRHQAQVADDVDCWERLAVPVQSDDGIIVYSYTRMISLREDALRAMFDASMDGILYLKPILDDLNTLCDFRIAVVNQSACAMLQKSHDRLTGKGALQVYPELAQCELWQKLTTVYSNGDSQRFESTLPLNGKHTNLRVGLVKHKDGLLLSLVDITDLVQTRQAMEQQQIDLIFNAENLEKQAAVLADLADELEAARSTLAREVTRRERLELELRFLADTDAMTGFSNRRKFFSIGQSELKRAQRYHQPLSLIAFDIDKFKSINDAHGHAFGDAVIIELANIAQSTIRQDIDIAARTGGEEFVLLLPQTELEDAERVAERLRQAVAETGIERDGITIHVTVSLGVATLQDDTTIDALLHRADQALYAAKRAGRNTFKTSTETSGVGSFTKMGLA